MIKGDEIVPFAREGDEIEVITEKTPFYGEAGGQVGDQGVIFHEEFSLEVKDTIKPVEDIDRSSGEGEERSGEGGDGGESSGWIRDRRRAITLNHTATHLLQAVLREVLGDHVHQAGSLVAPDRLRFDFTHFAPMEKEELARVEALVNQKIRENLKVETKIMRVEEALQTGSHGSLWRKVRREGEGRHGLGLQHGALRRDPYVENRRYRPFQDCE